MNEDLEYQTVLVDAISKVSTCILNRTGDNKSSILHKTNNDFCPDIDVSYLISKLNKLHLHIETRDPTTLAKHNEKLEEFSKRLIYWSERNEQYLYNSNHAYQVVLGLLLIIDDIELFLEENTEPADPASYQKRLSSIRKNIESLERNVENSKSELGDIKDSIKTILEARDAALALPETLNTLRNTNSESLQIHEEISNFRETAEKSHLFIKEVDCEIRKRKDEIQDILNKCNDALRASTGVSLAAAFSKHAETLRLSSRYWVITLFISLAVMIAVGLWRINSILEMMKVKEIDTSIITLNMIFSLFLLAAPVWLAWIAAKRISHLFRLIEDYEFKAAISSAYEGYRKEAERFEDKNFSERILDSALTRFDEPPLRFVEKNEQVHPFFELLESWLQKKQKEEIAIKTNTSPHESEKEEKAQ